MSEQPIDAQPVTTPGNLESEGTAEQRYHVGIQALAVACAQRVRAQYRALSGESNGAYVKEEFHKTIQKFSGANFKSIESGYPINFFQGRRKRRGTISFPGFASDLADLAHLRDMYLASKHWTKLNGHKKEIQELVAAEKEIIINAIRNSLENNTSGAVLTAANTAAPTAPEKKQQEQETEQSAAEHALEASIANIIASMQNALHAEAARVSGNKKALNGLQRTVAGFNKETLGRILNGVPFQYSEAKIANAEFHTVPMPGLAEAYTAYGKVEPLVIQERIAASKKLSFKLSSAVSFDRVSFVTGIQNRIVTAVKSTFDVPASVESNTEKITKAREVTANLNTGRTEKVKEGWGKTVTKYLIQAGLIVALSLITGGVPIYSLAISFLAMPVLSPGLRWLAETTTARGVTLSVLHIALCVAASVILGNAIHVGLEHLSPGLNEHIQTLWNDQVHSVKETANNLIHPTSHAPVTEHPTAVEATATAPTIDTPDTLAEVQKAFETAPGLKSILTVPDSETARQIMEHGSKFNMSGHVYQIVETQNGGFGIILTPENASGSDAPTWRRPVGNVAGFWTSGTEAPVAAAPSVEAVPPAPDVGLSDPEAIQKSINVVPRPEVQIPSDAPGLQHAPSGEIVAVAAAPTGVPEFDLLGNPPINDVMREFNPKNMLEMGMSPEKVEMWGRLHDYLLAHRAELGIGDNPPDMRLAEFFGNSDFSNTDTLVPLPHEQAIPPVEAAPQPAPAPTGAETVAAQTTPVSTGTDSAAVTPPTEATPIQPYPTTGVEAVAASHPIEANFYQVAMGSSSPEHLNGFAQLRSLINSWFPSEIFGPVTPDAGLQNLQLYASDIGNPTVTDVLTHDPSFLGNPKVFASWENVHLFLQEATREGLLPPHFQNERLLDFLHRIGMDH